MTWVSMPCQDKLTMSVHSTLSDLIRHSYHNGAHRTVAYVSFAVSDTKGGEQQLRTKQLRRPKQRYRPLLVHAYTTGCSQVLGSGYCLSCRLSQCRNRRKAFSPVRHLPHHSASFWGLHSSRTRRKKKWKPPSAW